MKLSFPIKAAATTMAIALATSAIASADDLRGVWQGQYTVVSPTNANGPGPRFAEAEWRLDIKEQQGNVFWGESQWRRVGADSWNSAELTGNIMADGSGDIGMVETSPTATSGVNAIIDGRFDGDKIYVDFRSMQRGSSYSAVLERMDETG